MQKRITVLILLVLPIFAALLARNGYHLTGLTLSGLALIIFIFGVGIFGLRVLMSLFKQDNEGALKALVNLLIALGMALLTTVLMVGTNPSGGIQSAKKLEKK